MLGFTQKGAGRCKPHLSAWETEAREHHSKQPLDVSGRPAVLRCAGDITQQRYKQVILIQCIPSVNLTLFLGRAVYEPQQPLGVTRVSTLQIQAPQWGCCQAHP